MAQNLYQALDEVGLLDYGQHIDGDVVRDILGLVMPDVGTKRDFDEIALAELSAVDNLRETLLSQGKYIAGTKGGYRILLPSENADQIDRYLGHAQNKIRRARKLERCSPAMSKGKPNQTRARMMMIERSIRKRPPGDGLELQE